MRKRGHVQPDDADRALLDACDDADMSHDERWERAVEDAADAEADRRGEAPWWMEVE